MRSSASGRTWMFCKYDGRDGFAKLTVLEHLRTVVQLARWAERRHVDLARWDDSILAGFRRHSPAPTGET